MLKFNSIGFCLVFCSLWFSRLRKDQAKPMDLKNEISFCLVLLPFVLFEMRKDQAKANGLEFGFSDPLAFAQSFALGGFRDCTMTRQKLILFFKSIGFAQSFCNREKHKLQKTRQKPMDLNFNITFPKMPFHWLHWLLLNLFACLELNSLAFTGFIGFCIVL